MDNKFTNYTLRVKADACKVKLEVRKVNCCLVLFPSVFFLTHQKLVASQLLEQMAVVVWLFFPLNLLVAVHLNLAKVENLIVKAN